jgi:hypothetical protein
MSVPLIATPKGYSTVNSPTKNMGLKQKIRRATIRTAYPAVATYYRSRPGTNYPRLILEFLGIADSSYRTDFYTLSRIVREAGTKGGLIAECGVYRGATLLGMAHILKNLGDYQLVGFDSFEGFPAPVREDALQDGSYHSRALQGVFSDTSYEELSRKVRLLGFEQHITLVKGYFEKTLRNWSDKSFSIVHLDVDLYQSYLTCLQFFYPRVRSGGYVVFDEYDFIADVYPGAQKAIDAFLLDKPERIQCFAEASKPRYFIVKQ